MFKIIKLLRLNAPAGYFLVFFPSFWGMNINNTDLNWQMVFAFFVSSILIRGAGCIINDIFDKDFDSKVLRTQNRPIASGELSVNFAVFILGITLIPCAFVLFTLPTTAIYIGLISIPMIMLYPLMKRYTHFPQVFLGFTFNLGALIGYASVHNSISSEAFILYLACCMWTIGYDSIYGFMDIEYDKRIGVKSLSIFIEHKNYKLFIGIMYLGFSILFLLSNIHLYKIGFLPLYLWIIAQVLLFLQVINLEIHNPQKCKKLFFSNVHVGFLLSSSQF
jgi:4-hydroxybenzoate polyprenyltransferase